MDPPNGIVIVITRGETGRYVAECKTLDTFGEGDSLVEALSDLAESVKEGYDLLIENKDYLSKHTEELLKRHTL